MGPYCDFCDTRCFAYLPLGTPRKVIRAYGTASILATCPTGQAFEKARVGYCFADIVRMLERRKPRAFRKIQTHKEVV